MLNLLAKTKLGIVASLLAAATAFAQDNTNNTNNTKCRPQKGFDQGHEVMKNQMMPAYSAPARVEVRGSWDVYATASFIYWQAREENLELGFISNSPTPFGASGISPAASESSFVGTNFTYKPGFKVALGANLDWDNWDVCAEYTWFHGTVTTNVGPLVPVGDFPVEGNKNFLFPEQGSPAVSSGAGASRFYNAASQSWNLKMDLLDLSLARAYYSGTKLTVRPFFGARGAWIRQTMTNSYVGNPIDSALTAPFNWDQLRKTISWGVGPRAGFESNWMMGYGFRAIGNGAFDVLYTRYDVRSSDIVTDTDSGVIAGPNARVTGDDSDYLRAHANLDLGFGWGSYFDNNNWHVDVSATYTYQVFWDQNMFINFVESTMPANTINPNGNLYVHGMTLTARVDF